MRGTSKTFRVGCILLLVCFAFSALALLPQPARAFTNPIPVGAPAVGPREMGASPDGAYVAVAIQGGTASSTGGTVSVIQTSDNSVATFDVPDGYPQCVAMPNDHIVYVTTEPEGESGGGLYMIDTTANTVTQIETQTTVTNGPWGVAVSHDGSDVFVVTGNSVLVFDATSYAQVGSVPGLSLPRDIAITPDGSLAYVADQGSNSVTVFSTASPYNVVATISGFDHDPWGVAITPDGSQVYVANSATDTVSVIATSLVGTGSNPITATITGITYPHCLAVTPDGAYVYAPIMGDNEVAVISTVTNTVVDTITGFGLSAPWGVVAPNNCPYVYVANNGGNSVSVINAPTEWPMFHHDLDHTGYTTNTGPTTNNVLWSYLTGDSVDSSPAVLNGVVYVGSEDYNVYALNATTGKSIWSYPTDGYVYSSPAVANGVVYVGSEDDYLYALNATTGKSIWSYKTGAFVDSSPEVAGGIVYVGSEDSNVYALNATTGKSIWSYTTNDGIFSSPAVVNELVYVASQEGTVYALNATTGKLVWSNPVNYMMRSSPAVVNGFLYMGAEDDNIYALNATTGAFIWSYPTASSAWFSSPAVANGVVYVGSFDDNVYALNATTGKFIWSYPTDNNIYSSPAVANGVVYIGSNDGKFYALNATTAPSYGFKRLATGFTLLLLLSTE